MRRRRRTSKRFPLLLAASLAGHAAVTVTAISLGPRAEVASVRPTTDRPQRTPPPTFAVPPVDLLGADGGLGEALADAAGERPAESKLEGSAQPLLGAAAPGPLAEGENAPQTSAAQALASAAPTSPTLPPAPPADALADALRFTEPTPNASPEALPAQPAPTPPPPSPPAAPSADAAPSEAATDPGRDADNEVDLFATDATADFRDGATVAQEGRNFEISGLRQGLASFLDLVYMPRPVVLRFRIRLDAGGTPLSVDVAQSSGSRSLDETVKKALYRSWFDPDPGKTGRLAGRAFTFTLRIV